MSKKLNSKLILFFVFRKKRIWMDLIPQEIFISSIIPFLELPDKNNCSSLSKLHHDICKGLDKGRELLPRKFRIFQTEDNFGCYVEPFENKPEESNNPFSMSIGIRTWEPVLDFEIDVGQIFKDPGKMGIRLSFVTYFTGTNDKETRAVVSIHTITLDDQLENKCYNYYIGWCKEKRSQKVTFLIAKKKEQRIKVQCTEKRKTTIATIESPFLDLDEKSGDFYKFLRGNSLHFVFFGVLEA